MQDALKYVRAMSINYFRFSTINIPCPPLPCNPIVLCNWRASPTCVLLISISALLISRSALHRGTHTHMLLCTPKWDSVARVHTHMLLCTLGTHPTVCVCLSENSVAHTHTRAHTHIYTQLWVAWLSCSSLVETHSVMGGLVESGADKHTAVAGLVQSGAEKSPYVVPVLITLPQWTWCQCNA